MNKETNKNAIFYRVTDEEFCKLNRIKDTYSFRSNAELARTVMKVFIKLYGSQQKSIKTIESEIEDTFRELESGDIKSIFNYEKPKKIKKYPTLNEFEN